MPLYEYLCPSCGHKFEVHVQHKYRNELQWCDRCGTESPRIYSAPALRGETVSKS